MAVIRRFTALLLVVAVVVSTSAHAMPMLSVAKADSASSAMLPGSKADACKIAVPDLKMKAGCLATCAPLFALVQPDSLLQRFEFQTEWAWTSESGTPLRIKPDTSPPRT
jgi:hypothetical protein